MKLNKLLKDLYHFMKSDKSIKSKKDILDVKPFKDLFKHISKKPMRAPLLVKETIKREDPKPLKLKKYKKLIRKLTLDDIEKIDMKNEERSLILMNKENNFKENTLKLRKETELNLKVITDKQDKELKKMEIFMKDIKSIDFSKPPDEPKVLFKENPLTNNERFFMAVGGKVKERP